MENANPTGSRPGSWSDFSFLRTENLDNGGKTITMLHIGPRTASGMHRHPVEWWAGSGFHWMHARSGAAALRVCSARRRPSTPSGCITVQLRSAGQMDSRERRGPVVVSEEFTHDHMTEHDAVYINRATEPRRGRCFHLEEQRKDSPADLSSPERFLCFSRWATQIIIDES